MCRSEFYHAMKEKYNRYISYLVKTDHCVVVEDITRKVIGEIRDKHPQDYECVGVRDFDLEDSGKSNNIELMKLTQHIWTEYWNGHPRKINHYVNQVDHNMIRSSCLIYLI